MAERCLTQEFLIHESGGALNDCMVEADEMNMSKSGSGKLFTLTRSEKNINEELLRSILFGFFALSTVFVGISVIFLRHIFYRALLIEIIAFLLYLAAGWMIPRGYGRLASWVTVSGFWLGTAYLSYTGGGVDSAVFIGNVLIILIASILVGSRGAFLILLASFAYGWFLTLAEIGGSLPPNLQYAPFEKLFITLFLFMLALVLQRVATRVTSEVVARAQVSEKQYQTFLERIPIITYANDLSSETRTTYISPQVASFLGYPKEEFINDPLLWKKIIHPEDAERVLRENERISETLEDFDIDYRLIAKDGQVVWMKDLATLIRDENSNPLYWLGVWSDITSIKEAEKLKVGALDDLTSHNNQLRTASEVSRAVASILELDQLLPKVVELIRSHFEYYYVGLFLADENFEMLTLSAATGEAGEKMLEFKHSLQIGDSSMVGWCVANNQARIALDVGQDAMRLNNPLLPLTRSELDLPLRARGRVIGAMTFQSDEEAAFTESDITALQTMSDQAANAIETARLFTDRTLLIKELEAKNAELEQFAYTVSHDLKSPLVTMRGYLGYLSVDAHKGDFDRFEKDLNRVISATTTMQDLLNDLLTLSKVGRTMEISEDVPLRETVKQSIDLIYDAYTDRKVQIKVVDELPSIHANPTRLAEIIQNLLSNALKFSRNQETPLIEIGVSGTESKTGFPILFIRDNGMGIDKKYHKQIFGLFNRLDTSVEGTGVGLALVKRIVEMYGGHIWVESAGAGQGCTFYLTLPPAESAR
ncbi:MAG: PAS domain-containing protein [Anaerolineales bacterium]|nr:PAS domain-containing protein [Anaerolineales bacterium]